MAQLLERNITNKPRALGDTLAYANAKDATLLKKLQNRSGKLTSMQLETNVRLYRKGNRTPVQEGAAVSTINSNTGKTITNVAQIFQDAVGVSQVAKAVVTATEKPGRQLERQLEESTVAQTRMIEGAFFSAQEAQVEDGTNHWATRGLFSYASPTAQTNLPIDAAFRPAAGQKYTSTLAAFGEEAWKAVAASCFSSVDGQVQELDGYVGIALKQKFDLFTEVCTIGSNQAGTARYSRDMPTEFVSKVTRVVVSGLTVNLMETNRLLTDVNGDATADTPNSGIFIDPDMFKVGYVEDIYADQLGKKGGGEEWYTESIVMLIAENVKACCSVIATTA